MPPRLTPLCSPPGSAERETTGVPPSTQEPGEGAQAKVRLGLRSPITAGSSNSRGPLRKRVEEACGGGGWEARLPRV